METFKLKPIGYVRNDFNEPVDFSEVDYIKNSVTVLEINKEFEDGLFAIEKLEFIKVFFYFHKSEDFNFICETPLGEHRGVFACRSPRRPNNIGTTTVKLIKRVKNKLYVTGIDAINDTPILDIKNADTILVETHPLYIPRYKENPRVDIETLIEKNKVEALLLKTGQIHGHYCVGSSLGVIASFLALKEIEKQTDNLVNIEAEVRTQSCFIDGVQLVTGCTIGNKKLTLLDGNVFSLILKHKACNLQVEVLAKDDIHDKIDQVMPSYSTVFKTFKENKNKDPKVIAQFKEMTTAAAFKILELDLNTLFNVKLTALADSEKIYI